MTSVHGRERYIGSIRAARHLSLCERAVIELDETLTGSFA